MMLKNKQWMMVVLSCVTLLAGAPSTVQAARPLPAPPKQIELPPDIDCEPDDMACILNGISDMLGGSSQVDGLIGGGFLQQFQQLNNADSGCAAVTQLLAGFTQGGQQQMLANLATMLLSQLGNGKAIGQPSIHDLSKIILLLTFIGGNVCQAEGNTAQALKFYEMSIAAAQTLKLPEVEGMTRSNIGVLYLYRGEYDKAVVQLEQAKDLVATNREILGGVQANLGLVYTNQGNYAEAIAILEDAKNNLKDSENTVFKATALNNMGMALQLQADRQFADVKQATDTLTKARAAYDEGLTAIESATPNPAMQEALNTPLVQQFLTLVSKTFRSQDQARFKLLLALLEGKNPAIEIAIRYNRAVTDLALAQTQQTEARKNKTAVSNSDFLSVTSDLKSIQQDAAEYGLRDLESVSVVALAFTQLLAQDGKSAQASAEAAMTLVDERLQPDAAAITLLMRGLAAEFQARQTKDPQVMKRFEDQAIGDYTHAMRLGAQALNRVVTDGTIGALSGVLSYTPAYQRLAALLAQRGDVRGAYQAIEQGHATLTRLQIQTGQVDLGANADAADVQKERALGAALSQARLDLLTAKKNENTDTSALESEVSRLEAEYQKQITLMQSKGYAAREVAGYTAPLTDVQKLLSDDTALLVYKMSPANPSGNPVFEGRAFVLVITRSGSPRVIWLDSASTKTDVITTYAEERPWATKPSAAPLPELQELHNLLVKPVLDQVKANRFVIVPDAPLTYLPFAAFYDGNAKKYLIEQKRLSMAPSATSLYLLQSRKPAKSVAKKTALVIGNPDASQNPNLKYLNHVASEVISVSTQFARQGYQVVSTTLGSEQSVRNSVASKAPTALFLAAHAELVSPLPFSPLYLQPVSGTVSLQTDGRLEAREMYQLNLSGTELVVLSACDTAGGQADQDVGVFNRAFFAAGANRVVSSLWLVDDQAISLLTSEFVRLLGSLKPGETDADALAGAMDYLRKKSTNGQTPYAAPFYWAALSLSGLP